MKAEVLVVHDCDKDKLKAMGLEFIRYTRPVDQFDRISMTRQDRSFMLGYVTRTATSSLSSCQKMKG